MKTLIELMTANADVSHKRAQKCQEELRHTNTMTAHNAPKVYHDGSKYAAIRAMSAEYELAMAIMRGDK